MVNVARKLRFDRWNGHGPFDFPLEDLIQNNALCIIYKKNSEVRVGVDH